MYDRLNWHTQAFGGMFCLSGLLGIYGSCATLAGYCMSRHFGVAGINVFKLKVSMFTLMHVLCPAAQSLILHGRHVSEDASQQRMHSLMLIVYVVGIDVDCVLLHHVTSCCCLLHHVQQPA